MTKDQLHAAVAWAEAEAEKAWKAAEYFAAAPDDYDGHCRDKAQALRENAQNFEVLVQAAKESSLYAGTL